MARTGSAAGAGGMYLVQTAYSVGPPDLVIAGLTQPSSGSITVDGRPISGPGLDRSVVFQQYTLLPWRTVAGNVELALESRRVPRGERAEIIRELLARVGLRDAWRASRRS